MTISNLVPFLDEDDWPYENGTLVLPLNFFDEDDAEGVPETLTWTLKNFSGQVVNEMQNIEIVPSADITLVLTGVQLVVGDYGTDRELQFSGTYDSQLGTLRLDQAVRFYIRPRV